MSDSSGMATGVAGGSSRRSAHGIMLVSFAELWERASFYSLSAMMALYAVATVDNGGLGWSTIEAVKLTGNYALLVFGLPIFLGIVGDRLTGHYRAVVLGGMIIVAGHGTLFMAHNETWFWVGLILVACGTGLLKPAMPCLVGSFYPEQQLQRDRAFKWYYSMINIGSALGQLVTAGIMVTMGFKWAFLWAGLGMVVALGLLIGARTLVPEIERGKPQRGGPEQDEEGDLITGTRLRLNITVLLVLFGLFLLWAMAYGVFAGTADTELIAKDFVDRRIGDWTVPTICLGAIEPALIVLATPLITLGISRLAKCGRFPGMPSQMLFGAVLSTVALIGLAFVVKTIPAGASSAPVIGLGVFATLYAVMSIGEIFISPVYMALITRLAPRRLQGTFQGLCLLAMGLLGFISSRIGAAAEMDGGVNRFSDYLVTGLVVMGCIVVFIPLVPWMQRTIRRWNPGHYPGGEA